MTKEERQQIVDVVADLGTHCTEFPDPTDRERQLLNSIQFLCMAIVRIMEE